MAKLITLLASLLCAFICTEALTFQGFDHSREVEVRPKNLDELKKALCDKYNSQGICIDNTPRRIIVDGEFDFTKSEGVKEEKGCYHLTDPPQCLQQGQRRLNVNNQCRGMTPAKITLYSAGPLGMGVGSNKVIIGENNGALKGKGLRLYQSQNVEIRNLRIHDINPHVIWGGDAIDLINVKNVMIDGCYIKNIGRQMIVTHYGPSTQVTIQNTVFDGRTPFSAYCDGDHYWLWLFLGQGDQITLQNNVIHNTAGRGPHLVGSNKHKNLLHIVQNTFYDVSHLGLIDLDDDRSSILVEGNIFKNVAYIVHRNKGGHLFMPQTPADQALCTAYLGRQCLKNMVMGCAGHRPVNSVGALQAFKPFANSLAKPIEMGKSMLSRQMVYPSDLKNEVKALDIVNKAIIGC